MPRRTSTEIACQPGSGGGGGARGRPGAALPRRPRGSSPWAAARAGSSRRPRRPCARLPATASPTPSRPPSSRAAARRPRGRDQPQRHDHRGTRLLEDARGGDAHHRDHGGRRHARGGRTQPPCSPSPTSARSCRRASPPAPSRSSAPTWARTSTARADAERALTSRFPTTRRRSTTSCSWGRLDVGLAHEAALKLRESAQAHTECYPAMEYRHGPISVAGPPSLVWILGSPDPAVAATSPRPAQPCGSANSTPWPNSYSHRTAVALAEARARPRPSAPPDPLGGAARGGNRMRSRRSKKRLVVPAIAAIALVAVACTSGSDSARAHRVGQAAAAPRSSSRCGTATAR